MSEIKNKIHELKCWLIYFPPVVCGDKKFECRLNDRDYKVGDFLLLKEWDPETKEYTGRVQEVIVDYILRDFVGLQPGYVLMSISKIDF